MEVLGFAGNDVRVEWLEEEGVFLATNSHYPELFVKHAEEDTAIKLMNEMIEDMDEKLDMRVLR